MSYTSDLMGLGMAPALADKVANRGYDGTVQFGKGTGSFLGSGNSYRTASAGSNPGGTGGDYVLATYTIPASSFDAAGRGIRLLARGAVANNTNAKQIKIFFGCTAAVVGSAVSGGTAVADTGSYTTTGAAGWVLEAEIFKYGAAGSNTQIGCMIDGQIGATASTIKVPSALTATESGAIIVAVTGNATTAATDITFNLFEAFAMD